MTAAQQARTVGFRASLAVRGIDVSLEAQNGSTEVTVKALIEKLNPIVPEYGKQIERSELVRLHVLRTSLAGHPVVTGRIFIAESKRYRVVNVVDNAISVALVFECRESSAS